MTIDQEFNTKIQHIVTGMLVIAVPVWTVSSIIIAGTAIKYLLR